jgi:hypothetical protein
VNRMLAMCVWVCGGLASTAVAGQVTPAAGYTPPDDTQAVRIGAVIFYDYTFMKAPRVTDAAGNLISTNAFNLVRTYINVTGNISHIVAFRITPDISRETGAGSSNSGSLVYRTKYGYAQFNLDDWTGSWKTSWVRVGIQQTPIIDFQEAAYRYRFQGTLFAERETAPNGQTFMPSADNGATFHTAFPNGYGDVHFGLYNGEGYTRAEANDQKAFEVRASVRPMPMGEAIARGIRLTVFYDGDHYVKGSPRNRFITNASLEHRRLNAGFDFMKTADQTLPTAARIDGRGVSFWVTPFFKEKGNGFEALIRYDRFRPNVDADAWRDRLITGVAYWFPHPGGNSTAALLLDFEQARFRKFTTPQATQQKIVLHGLINF